jgi:hypothetical protein
MKAALKLLAIILFPFLIGLSLPESDEKLDESTVFGMNPDHLDGPFTGGFGEQTCHSCHFDYDLNMEGGQLTVDGISDSYKPGTNYEIDVTIQSEHPQKRRVSAHHPV